MDKNSLLTSQLRLTQQIVEELIEIAITECERFYPAFQYVLWAGYEPKQAVEATLFDTAGEA